MFLLIRFTSKVTFPAVNNQFYSTFAKSNLIKLLETMPKEPKHIAEAQRQRFKIKEKSQKYVPGKVILQVLGTGAEGAPKSLYMFTDQSRYLFNCGEGTQRLAHEHKMKLAKLEHIFITHPSWDNIGGLPGVSLTIQDVGVPQITLHGPEGLDELFIATQRFVILRDLTITTADCKPEEQYVDNVMAVTYVPIIKTQATEPSETNATSDKEIQATNETIDASTSTRRNRSRSRNRKSQSSKSEESSEDDTDYYAHQSKKKRRRCRSRFRYRSASGSRPISRSPPSELFHVEREQNKTMCYICRLHPRPGALSLEKCVEAGVTPGPLLGQLKAGNDITLKSGVVVKSKDVCLPDDPGPVFLVVDCPTVDYLDSLVNNKEFEKHQATAICDEDLAFVIVHFTPAQVMKEQRYRDWIDKFSPSTRHLILNESNYCMGSEAVHRIQYKLNMLNNDLFPLLGDNGTEISPQENNTPPVSKKLKTDNGACQHGETTKMIENLSVNSRPSSPEDVYPRVGTLCKMHLRPQQCLDRSDELRLTPSLYLEETMSVEGFSDALNLLKEKEDSKTMTVNDYPRLMFLGTGSCIPNKTRNTSGILVQPSETCAFLMDCGEGTYGQLVRFFGLEKARFILANLKAVYISHLHADHHIGLMGLLKGRRKALTSLGLPLKPLLIFAPKQILSWLNLYNRRFERISNDYELIANGDMVMNSHNVSFTQKQMFENDLEMCDISTVGVRHCPNAFGVAFTHKDGWKLTYSGDTMPCQNLIELGLNSDVLIHEATMEDELAHEAITKMHSTTSQAIKIGQDMKAKHILLTHFSQRYAKLPRFNDNFADNVGIAFDNMQIRLDEMHLLPSLNPALRLMFAEHYEELEHKAVKRQLKAQRQKMALNR